MYTFNAPVIFGRMHSELNVVARIQIQFNCILISMHIAAYCILYAVYIHFSATFFFVCIFSFFGFRKENANVEIIELTSGVAQQKSTTNALNEMGDQSTREMSVTALHV